MNQEILDKWNSLYGNAEYTPEEVLQEFNIFIQTYE